MASSGGRRGRPLLEWTTHMRTVSGTSRAPCTLRVHIYAQYIYVRQSEPQLYIHVESELQSCNSQFV